MEGLLTWAAPAFTIAAALMTASNLGARITGIGFIVFTAGSLCWLSLGALTGQPSLLWQNVALTGLNLFGVWRWLGRQAAIEDGGKAAQRRSERTPGEALFPLSLLERAKVLAGDTEVGSATDAMAGANSGQIAYVVVAEGGVAGVGERLRRLDWHRVHVDGERLVFQGTADQFHRLRQLERDDWPGR